MNNFGHRTTKGLIAFLVISISAGSVSASFRTIQQLFKLKEYEKAENQLMKEIGGFHGRTLSEAKLMLARLQTAVEAAIRLYREVSSSSGEKEALRARLELAKIYYSTGNYREVTALLGYIPENGRSADRIEAIYFRGLSWMELGNTSRAIGDFKLIDRGDYLYWGYISLAEIDIKYGRISEAIERYEMLASSHSNPIAGFRLGECYETIGDNEKALNVYRNLSRLFPESLEAPKAREKIQMLSTARLTRSYKKNPGGGDRKEFLNADDDEIGSEIQYYTLQFGAFSIEENATVFAEQLGAVIEGLKIESVETRGRTWHRVRVGRYSSREEAEADAVRFMELSGYSSKILPVE